MVKSKCGEIFRMDTDGTYCFICFHCGDEFHTAISILHHINLHFNNETKPLTTPIGNNIDTTPVEEIKIETVCSIVEVKHEEENDNIFEQFSGFKNTTAADFVLPVPAVNRQCFRCDLCAKEFSSKTTIKRHITVKHVTRSPITYSCDKCSKAFRTKTGRRKHLAECHSMTDMSVVKRKVVRPPKICLPCGKPFEFKCDYDKHFETHSIGPHYCYVCRIEAKDVKALIRHIRRNHSRFSCTHCNDTFVSRNELQLHTINVHRIGDVKPFKCELCNRQYLNAKVYEKHVHSHATMVDSHPCSSCPKVYPSLGKLNDHCRRVHLGVRKHQCAICGQLFWRRSFLEVHMMRHKNEKLHKCSQCDRAFYTAARLRQHFTVHTGDRPFVCDTCGRAFRTLANLKNHALLHDEKKFECEWCEKRFTQPNSRRLHVKAMHGGGTKI